MKTNQIYIFRTTKGGFPMIFNVAVNQELQAKHVVKDCFDKASLKINYSLLNIKEEENPEKINGLFVLLEARMMDSKFYPTGEVLQYEEDAQKWTTEYPVGVERKFESVERMKPSDAINRIFQNS
jgi:hypothetical protein